MYVPSGGLQDAYLYFVLNVYLHRFQPSAPGFRYLDATGGATLVDPWTDVGWHTFQADFRRVVTRGWNNHFWLMTPSNYHDLDWPQGTPTHRLNVKCGLELSLATHQSHNVMYIDCVNAQSFFRSSMTRQRFRGELDHVDAAAAPVTATPTQTTVLHEVGHLLGLDHVAQHAAACVPPTPTQPAVAACYGTTVWQRGDLMGMGNRVEQWHAGPWKNRIRYHTGVGGWTVSLNREPPTSLAMESRRVERPETSRSVGSRRYEF